MTAELWLHRLCPHGASDSLCVIAVCTHAAGEHPKDKWGTYSDCYCRGGSRVRLDPERVVFKAQVPVWEDVTVKDIIDALTDTNGTIVSFTQEADDE